MKKNFAVNLCPGDVPEEPPIKQENINETED